MNREFVPYEQALALKELGFDEPCLSGYNFKDRRNGQFTYPSAKDSNTTTKARIYHNDKKIIGSPLYQQAFRWFRDKHGLFPMYHKMTNTIKEFYSIEIVLDKEFNSVMVKTIIDEEENDLYASSYEEAEMACLKKLIEIVKSKKDE